MQFPPPGHGAEPTHDVHLLDYWHVLLSRRRFAIATTVAVAALGVLRAFVMQPTYEGVAQILVERETPKVLAFKEVAELDAGRDDYYQTQLKLLQSRALVRRAIHTLNLLQHPEYGGPRSRAELDALRQESPETIAAIEKATDKFLERLRVQWVRNSRLLTVAYQSSSPEMAALVANKLCELYIQQSLDFRFSTSAEAGVWLGGQAEGHRKKVEAADATLQLFKEREGIVNIEERRSILDQKLKDLGSSLTALKTQRIEKQALWRQMSAAKDAQDLPEVMRDGLVQSLRVELATLERQEAELLGRYGPKHPEVLKVQKQLKETRRKMAGEAQRVINAAENDYQAASARENSVSQALEAAKAEALDLSRRSVQYDSLKRELDASKEVLNSILTRQKETDVTQELKSSNIRIVDPATVSREPVRPRRTRDILLGIVLGMTLGVSLAFFLDYLDNTIKTPDDVRTRMGATLLTVVPDAKSVGKVASGLLLRADLAETAFGVGYRLLRTALNYSWTEKKPRVLVITSTAPNEGKTLTSVNLSLCLAMLDSRVLLIDADLRKAQAHSVLNCARSPGLSDVLVGEASLADAIHSPAGSRLHLLPAGSAVPSPSDLLAAEAMSKLLAGLRESYDWVVIDTPPVAAVSDGLTLAPLGDGVIVIAGAEMVPRRTVSDSLDRISATGARILGIVLNRAQIDKYAHSYGYGQYYGEYYGQYFGVGVVRIPPPVRSRVGSGNRVAPPK